MNYLELMLPRTKLLARVQQDESFKEVIKEKCRLDIKFFFEMFLYTIKNPKFLPKDIPNDVPFVLFEYQEEFVDVVWDSICKWESVFVEKSRQMWITRMIMGIYVYWYLFHNHNYLIISRTQDEVDRVWDIKSCFQKIRYLIQNLPQWMLPPDFDKKVGTNYNKFMNVSRWDWNGTITWESANQDASRWGTYHAIFLDEMWFMQNATSINQASWEATDCRIINSTPNWEWNEYYKMKLLAEQWELIHIRLHRTIHPYYDQEWYAKKIKGKTPESIAAELEINYNVAIKGRVYPLFQPAPAWAIRIWTWESFDYDYTLPLYVSIDNSHWGADPHAVWLYQPEPNTWLIRVIDSVQLPSYTTVTEMAYILAKQPKQGYVMDDQTLAFYTRYLNYKSAIFIADPHDTNSTMNDTTIYKEYAKVGITLNLPKLKKSLNWSQIQEQINITTKNLNKLKIHERNTEYISCLQNASYPENKEGSNRTTAIIKPKHNWTSHHRTQHEYFMLWYDDNEEKLYRKKHTKPQPKREIKNHITGQINYI